MIIFLCIDLDISEFKRGPGIWMLNTSILNRIQDLIRWNMKNELYKEDKKIWWDNVKYEIKGLTIEHSKQLQKMRGKKK